MIDSKATARQLKHIATTEERNRLNRDIVVHQLTLCTEGATGDTLVDQSDLKLLSGRKYALVGRNGVGKTTLLRHLAEHAIEGLHNHLRVRLVDDGSNFVSLESACDELSALDYLLGLHKERIATMKELQHKLDDTDCTGAVDTDAVAAIVDQLRMLNADTAEARARKILHGLGISPDVRMAVLSGGWKHRVALASALFVEDDVLLLDEPTNSLDLMAVRYLEKHLRDCKTTVVVVSHDFAFIDAFADTVIELADKKLVAVDGNYTHFVEVREAEHTRHRRQFKIQEHRRANIEQTIAVLRARAVQCPQSTTGMIRSRLLQLTTRLGEVRGQKWKYSLMGPRPELLAPVSEEPTEFELRTDLSDLPDDCATSDVLLIRCDNVGHAYPNWQGFADVSLDVTISTRLALIGQNGSGKSTLLRILTGAITPSCGTILRWDGLRIGFVDQHACKRLTSDLSALHWLRLQFPDLTEDEAGSALAAFGIPERRWNSHPLRLFSDGQRARLLLAALQLTQPHLVVLDEPTSHLDAESASALATALNFFPGAVVVASHDRSFIASLDADKFAMDDRLFGPYNGTLDQYADEFEATGTLSPRKTPGNAKIKSEFRRANDIQVPIVVPSVSCRKCGGPHFSMKCDQEQPQHNEFRSPVAKKIVADVNVPTVTQADDGKGAWKVVVSKQTLRKLRKPHAP